MIKVTATNINEFVRKVKEEEKKGYIMVGLPMTGNGKYSCIMTPSYKMEVAK